ncbi:MAG: LON peptidase substrate-binding domain-containing protein, partial [Candidatus Saccharimonas sp.]|nr:LON peptidase substrate-binding domain-containing protein [Planctomycetaceae bacterium]
DAALEHFSGLAPLFPLPNVVLFPHGLLPLHIFESRYRQMTADALNGEQLIAMSLLQPGWEKTPNQLLPPIHSMVGLGQIVAHERLDDVQRQQPVRKEHDIRKREQRGQPRKMFERGVGETRLRHSIRPSTVAWIFGTSSSRIATVVG